jgi:peptide/nickel transport system permease protein
MGFKEYIVKRALQSLLLFFLAITANFVLFRMMPGDPTLAVINPSITIEQRQYLIREFGLDKSLWEQYTLYIRNLFSGNMGVSFTFLGTPVAEVIFDRRIWHTLILSSSSMFLAVVIGTLLGIAAARRRGSKLDLSLTGISVILHSTPVFWSGLIVLLVFGFYLNLIPLGGSQTYGVEQNALEFTLDYLHHLVAPVLTLTSIMVASYFFVMRNSILDVFAEDYMLTAEAKGLSDRKIVFKHAFKNAFLPSLSLIAAQMSFLVGGATLTEAVFAWNGIGYLTYTSVQSYDFPVLQGIFLIVCVVVILANFVADMMYAYLDPRIRY